MPWSIPAEFQTCVFEGATVRCENCGEQWKLPTEPGSVGTSWCETCDADTLITVVEGGPGSVVQRLPFR